MSMALHTCFSQPLRLHSVGYRKKTSQLLSLTQMAPVIENDDEAAFYWSMISANWEMEESQALLQLIINHWITLRGFSLTGAFMEKYKQHNKRPLQKSKGLRKCLQGIVHVPT